MREILRELLLLFSSLMLLLRRFKQAKHRL
jgi:hypothetical protein